ncbi:class I SAM-dependent methyltransferase [Sphingomonas nostoxanthinifaciens]|uniref:class I SAM-dependent methyltransferase n=1 Tax=Sphingomonas nostoxanthinifaciens TaxID=2872652 RepID=UPI001CC206E8|nr:class I SAM-dependent methyltransferase [Sphingomonas nostoxanthinifaciens]UAK24931.1 class I SAM-dependent methyltransferase [Sphingomonas nostoxanthinifaciens]
MASRRQQITPAAFDAVYDRFVRPGGFHEHDDYYDISHDRYVQTLGYLADIALPDNARLLDIGGGQMAILGAKLFGFDAVIGDINENFRGPADDAGIGFAVCNLIDDDPPAFKGAFDAVVLAEVVEHLPMPPYIVLSKVRTWLKPGGALLVTTPNLFRLRNTARMLLGRDPFDRFMMPRHDVSLGHQTEYSGEHLAWQIREAGFTLERLEHDQLGATGFSWKARLARTLLSPLTRRKAWREELVAVGRNPA